MINFAICKFLEKYNIKADKWHKGISTEAYTHDSISFAASSMAPETLDGILKVSFWEGFGSAAGSPDSTFFPLKKECVIKLFINGGK